MANVNPTFVSNVTPYQVATAPVSPADNTAGNLLNAGDILNQYYKDSLARELEKSKIKGQEYTNQNLSANVGKTQQETKNLPLEAEKIKSETEKNLKEAEASKIKIEALNELFNNKTPSDSNVTTSVPVVDPRQISATHPDAAAYWSNDAKPLPQDKPQVPINVVQTPAVNTTPNINPAVSSPIQSKMEPDLTSAHEIVKTIPDTRTSDDISKELEKWQKARAHGFISEDAYKTREHQLKVEPQLDAFAKEYDNFEKTHGRVPLKQSEFISITNKVSPDGEILKEPGIKQRLESLPKDENMIKDEVQGRQELGKELKDYRGVIPAYNKLTEQLSNPIIQQKMGNSLGYYKAITRSLGSSDLANGGGNLGIALAIMNAFGEKLGIGSLRSSPDPRDRAQMDILNHINHLTPEERGKILPSELAPIYSNLGNLINQSLKKQSGSAVSASEFERFAQQYGLNIYSDPDSFFNSLSEIGKNLQGELDYIKEGADPRVVDAFEKKGLLTIKPYQPIQGFKYETPKTLPDIIPKKSKDNGLKNINDDGNLK